jgi:hypothetical protein
MNDGAEKSANAKMYVDEQLMQKEEVGLMKITRIQGPNLC